MSISYDEMRRRLEWYQGQLRFHEAAVAALGSGTHEDAGLEAQRVELLAEARAGAEKYRRLVERPWAPEPPLRIPRSAPPGAGDNPAS